MHVVSVVHGCASMRLNVIREYSARVQLCQRGESKGNPVVSPAHMFDELEEARQVIDRWLRDHQAGIERAAAACHSGNALSEGKAREQEVNVGGDDHVHVQNNNPGVLSLGEGKQPQLCGGGSRYHNT